MYDKIVSVRSIDLCILVDMIADFGFNRNTSETYEN